jgi:hypothetical protein
MEFRNIQSFNEFLNEAATTKWYDLVFNSHKNHNPECDILEGHLDRNSLITYGIYVNGPNKGKEFMEYYSGPNYKPESVGTSRSSSRMYQPDKIPAKYLNMWHELREIYQNEYEGGRSTNEASRLVDDARIKKEADKLFIERYPRVNPYDIKDIEFDGKDDIIELIKIVKKRGEATDEEMMRDDYDYAVMKSMEKFGMFEKSDFLESSDIKNEAINLVRELQKLGKTNSGNIVGAKLTSNPDEIQIQKEFGSVIVKIIKVIK